MSFNSTMNFVKPNYSGGVGGESDLEYLGNQYEQQRNAYIQNRMNQQRLAAQVQQQVPQQMAVPRPPPGPHPITRSAASPRRNRR